MFGGGGVPLEAVPGGSEKYEVKLSKCCSQGTLLLPRILYFTEVLSPASDPLP